MNIRITRKCCAKSTLLLSWVYIENKGLATIKSLAAVYRCVRTGGISATLRGGNSRSPVRFIQVFFGPFAGAGAVIQCNRLTIINPGFGSLAP